MEELDGVILLKDFENLKKGVRGTILIKYNDVDYEVEFFDENHNSYGTYTISKDYIEVYWKVSEHRKKQ
jgi:hypothetical protein